MNRYNLTIPSFIRANECRGCRENCAVCGTDTKFRLPYPLGSMGGDRVLPNTYYRWVEDNQSAIHGASHVFAGNIEGLIEHQTVIKHFAEIVGKNRKLKPVSDLILQMTISQSQVVFRSNLYIIV